MSPRQDLEPLVALYGEVIAARRYEAWDEHARHLPWPEYKRQDPRVALGVYLEDGRADAEALMPYFTQLVESASLQSAAAALRGAAERLTGQVSVEALDVLRGLSDAYDDSAEQGREE